MLSEDLDDFDAASPSLSLLLFCFVGWPVSTSVLVEWAFAEFAESCSSLRLDPGLPTFETPYW